jgi:hypothetical protein
MENTNTPQEEPKRLAGYEIAIAVSLLAVFSLCICALLSSAGIWGYRVKTQQEADETATAIRIKANETATAVRADTLATARAEVQNYGFYEPFDTNLNKWETGRKEYGYVDYDAGEIFNYSIENGVYIWEIIKTSADGYSIRIKNDTQQRLTDFDASVNVKQVSGPTENICYGLVFRTNFIEQGLYLFRICESQSFSVIFHSTEAGWEDLISHTRSNAILRNDWNRMAGSVRGSHFVFSINNKVVGECDDDRVATGYVFLSVSVWDSDPRTFWFDDFALQNR